MIIAVDFDGVLAQDAFPNVGALDMELIALLKRLQNLGDRIILYTCREDVYKIFMNELILWPLLSDALRKLLEAGIVFDAVNTNVLHEEFDCWLGVRRKITADLYIDDKALGYTRENAIKTLETMVLLKETVQ